MKQIYEISLEEFKNRYCLCGPVGENISELLESKLDMILGRGGNPRYDVSRLKTDITARNFVRVYAFTDCKHYISPFDEIYLSKEKCEDLGQRKYGKGGYRLLELSANPSWLSVKGDRIYMTNFSDEYYFLILDDAKTKGYPILERIEGLTKGAPQRLMPYNPKDTKRKERIAVEGWQKDMGDRESIPRIEGSGRQRALRKLAAQTKWRRNPDTGEAEFLLHRGHSGKEIFGHSHKDKKSSWSPDHFVASAMTNRYFDPFSDDIPKVTSAWFKESDIHHILNQIGPNIVKVPKTEGSKKKPEYADENEVIIRPGHSGSLAAPDEIPSALLSENIKTIDDSINYRARLSSKDSGPGIGINKLAIRSRLKKDTNLTKSRPVLSFPELRSPAKSGPKGTRSQSIPEQRPESNVQVVDTPRQKYLEQKLVENHFMQNVRPQFKEAHRDFIKPEIKDASERLRGGSIYYKASTANSPKAFVNTEKEVKRRLGPGKPQYMPEQNTSTAHEAQHRLFAQIESKFSPRHSQALSHHFLSNLPQEERGMLEGYNAYRYDRNNPKFSEESVMLMRDLLTNRSLRDDFSGFLGHQGISDAEKQKYFNNLKSAWQNIYETSKKLTPEQLHEIAQKYNGQKS